MWITILTFLQNNRFCIWLSNPIKIAVIWITDLLNWIYDPFSNLTRNVDTKYNELLFVKAKKFENDLIKNFILYGTIWNYRIPFGQPIDTGDQILHHGIATAYWAIKYSMTKDSDDLLQLNNSVTGLQLHQTIHGEAKRRIIRGFRTMTDLEQTKYNGPISWANGDQLFFSPKVNLVIEDNASNDSAAGHLFGIYHAWKYGTPAIQAQCYALIRGLADELVNNDYSLVNADESKTEFGQLIKGVLTDPMRLSLCLAIFKVASIITGDPTYGEQYLKLRNLYGRLAIYPKVKLWWWDNDNDTPRAAMQLYILADLEQDMDWKERYAKGLHRVWKVVHKTGNIFVALLDNEYTFSHSKSETQFLKNRLSEFTLEDKQFDIQKINSTDVGYLCSQDIDVFTWNGNLRSNQPLAIWMLGAQDNFWQRNLNSVDNWIGQLQPTQQFNGIDFLIVYMFGRKLGIISDKE